MWKLQHTGRSALALYVGLLLGAATGCQTLAPPSADPTMMLTRAQGPPPAMRTAARLPALQNDSAYPTRGCAEPVPPPPESGGPSSDATVRELAAELSREYRDQFGQQQMRALGAALGVHAVVSNTNWDEEIREEVMQSAAGAPNRWEIGNDLGETWITVGALSSVWLADRMLTDDPTGQSGLGEWSGESLKAIAFGAPTVGVLQAVIGASRPGETPDGSQWNPFADRNGVSGHAFVGAVPFLVAARRCERPAAKTACLAGSAVSAYSRMYEDRHYFSQAMLGWFIAYLTVNATDAGPRAGADRRIIPLDMGDRMGIGVEQRY